MAATVDINDNDIAANVSATTMQADNGIMKNETINKNFVEKRMIEMVDDAMYDKEKLLLPRGPSTLCFITEDFASEDYDVDGFISSCRSSVSLETLRNDLKTYLDILKSSMVELINKDYADFVNLSTNLVGLDKAINNIAAPLGHIKEEVKSVKDSVSHAMDRINRKLKERADLRDKKSRLQRLLNISDSVDKIESLLQIGSTSVDDFSGTPDDENFGHLIERVAIEFNQLLFNLSQSEGLPFVTNIQPRIDSISKTLESSLVRLYEEATTLGHTDLLARCLRTYAAIDKVQEAEDLFRKIFVKPEMDKIITSRELEANGLNAIYTKILNFIPMRCGHLLEVTAETALTDVGRGSIASGGSTIRGYDFLVHSVWPEVASAIEIRLSSIFAPGNPDAFHQKYTTTLAFIDKFERHCGSENSIRRLRNHSSYKQFISKWNLTVYFHIRFKEIGEVMEQAYTTPFSTVPDSALVLSVTNILWSCINRCWSEDVFVISLSHLFWKLTLQLLSRFAFWLSNVKDNLPNFGLEELTKMSVGGDTSKNYRENKTDIVLSPTTHVINLIGDIDLLLPKIKEFYKDMIITYIKKLRYANFSFLKESIAEACENIEKFLPDFESHIIIQVANACKEHLDAASAVPRQYRHMNREMPSKYSTYVRAIFTPLRTVISERSDHITSDRCTNWVTKILQVVSDKYFIVIKDVLTAVEKTKDSLMKLRKNKTNPVPANSPGSSTAVSDEDKIRLQLQLDVLEFANEIEKFSTASSSLPACQQLVALVQSAAKSAVNET